MQAEDFAKIIQYGETQKILNRWKCRDHRFIFHFAAGTCTISCRRALTSESKVHHEKDRNTSTSYTLGQQ